MSSVPPILRCRIVIIFDNFIYVLLFFIFSDIVCFLIMFDSLCFCSIFILFIDLFCNGNFIMFTSNVFVLTCLWLLLVKREFYVDSLFSPYPVLCRINSHKTIFVDSVYITRYSIVSNIRVCLRFFIRSTFCVRYFTK